MHNFPTLNDCKNQMLILWLFRTHLTGAILHGHSATVFLYYSQWPHDPSLTINVLLQVRYPHSFIASLDLYLFNYVVLSHFQNLQQLSQPISKLLHIQLDITYNVYKNHVLSILSLLVYLEVFEEIDLLVML